MRILHVLSQTQPTGAETYALSLAERQLAAGHQVWVISDKLHFPTQAVYLPLPVHNRRYLQRLRNIKTIRALIKRENIDVVHAHSRAASWVSYYSCLGLPTAYVSTVHGRQHLHSSLKLHDIYGDRVIAICENLRTHLAEEVAMDPAKIHMIPNGVDFSEIDEVRKRIPFPSGERFRVAIAGRTTGPKGERTGELLQNVITRLLEKFPQVDFEVFGGEISHLPGTAQKKLEELKAKFPRRVSTRGFLGGQEFYEALARQHLIFGSGRVAMYAARLGATTIAIGESGAPGLLRPANLSQSWCSNFGDISTHKNPAAPSWEELYEQVARFISKAEPAPNLSQEMEARYQLQKISDCVEGQYRAAIARRRHPAHIPVLMYHKVVPAPIPTKHRTFVTTAVFESHLEFFRKQNLTPITFQQYNAFRSGARPWSEFPEKPIFLTFDDAYRNNLENALPLLKRFGFAATIFALGDTQARTNFWDASQGEPEEALMTPEELLEMQKSGIEIGAHSLSHRHLTRLDDAEARREILHSKQALETLLGRSVISFAYPYGSWDRKIRDMTEEAGFLFAVCTDTGGLHLEEDALTIFRVSIFPDDGPAQLRKKTSSWYRRYYRLKRGK